MNLIPDYFDAGEEEKTFANNRKVGQFKDVARIYGWLREENDYVLLEQWEWRWYPRDNKWLWKLVYIPPKPISIYNECPNGCYPNPPTYFFCQGLCACYEGLRGKEIQSKMPLPKVKSFCQYCPDGHNPTSVRCPKFKPAV